MLLSKRTIELSSPEASIQDKLQDTGSTVYVERKRECVGACALTYHQANMWIAAVVRPTAACCCARVETVDEVCQDLE